MTVLKNFTILVAAGAIVFALAGCRESEQNRPLTYTKGEYGGKPDQKLDQKKLDQLRLRGQQQSFN